jgi:UDPglucose 6-dehydrogenase
MGADALLLVTDWDEFRALDLERLAGMMHSRVLVDLRNVYAREEVARSGFHYVNIGEGATPVLDTFSVAAE